MQKQFYIYIMSNIGNAVLYTGVTSELKQRVYQHKTKVFPGFTAKYNVTKLVYFEVAENAESAIMREKQIKAGSRQKKIDLIQSINPDWDDLSDLL
ncbi:GIY-YIG nuclease family protein [Patescibacteria group bacterium]|nr:GIY-YIG nuclease family protein [Patescibacteria group bacterium]